MYPSLSEQSSLAAAETRIELSVRTKTLESNSANPQDLWKAAFASLKSDDPLIVQDLEAMIGAETQLSTGEELAQQVDSVISARLRKMKSRQWSYTWRGRPKKFRDQFRRVLEILITLKELPAAAASVDPVHFGLPLAGLSIILHLLSDEAVQYSAVIDGVETVASIISRYAVIEEPVLTEADLALTMSLQSGIIGVYVEVLKYQATVLRYLGRSSLSRTTRNMLRFDGWAEGLARILRADASCQVLIKFAGSQDQSFRMTNMEAILCDLKLKLDNALAYSETQEMQIGECIRMISDVSVHDQHNIIRSRLGTRYKESGAWLLKDPAYLSWKESKSGVFWLQGGIGTGKSAIASSVIESFLEDDDVRPAFYYCSKSSVDNKPIDIIRSTLAQLVSIPELIEGHLDEDMTMRDCISRKLFNDRNCRQFLPWVIDSPKNVVLIIDGLDECSDSIEFLDFLQQLGCQSGIRIFISSRPDARVKDHFPDASCVMITTEKTSEDMETFILGELELPERRNRSAMTPQLADRLATVLLERAETMFRWVELQIEVFLSRRKPLRHPRDIICRLEQLEANAGLPDLNNVYDQVYDTNTSPGMYERKLVEKAMGWLIACFHPVQLTELVEVVAIEHDGRVDSHISPGLLLDLCCNFIFEDDMGFVHFAHLSARDYLQQRRSAGLLEYSNEAVHARAAIICLHILKRESSVSERCMACSRLRPLPIRNIPITLFSQEEPPSRASNSNPSYLYDYAMEVWPLHCSKAGSLRYQDPLKKLFIGFMTSKPDRGIHRWLKLLESQRVRGLRDEYISKPLNPLFVACVWNFPEAYGALLISRNFRIGNVSNLAGPRGLAGDNTDTETEKIPFCKLKNAAGTAAFLLAARHGHLSLMKTMINTEGIDHCFSARGEWENTALHEAAKTNSVNVAAFLLSFGADVHAQNGGGDTALHLASESGHCAMIHLLMAHGADNSTRNFFGHSPIDLAAFSRSGNALDILNTGSNQHSRSLQGMSTLVSAG